MSSSLSMITCDEPLPSHLSPLDMALWSINNVNKLEFGHHSYYGKSNVKQSVAYIHHGELVDYNNEFVKAVSELINNDNTTDKVVVIPTSTMQKLWIDDVTLAIHHSSKGYFNATEWFGFCTATEFLVYKYK